MTSQQKSGTMSRFENFHVDFKKLISFAVAIREKPNQHPIFKSSKMEIFKGEGPVWMTSALMDNEITLLVYPKSAQLCWGYPSLHSLLEYHQIPWRRIVKKNEESKTAIFLDFVS